MNLQCSLTAALLLACAGAATAQYPGWKYAGSVYVLTTPEGTDLPASVSVENFPLLVRLHRDFFDFGQAKAGGDDLRFATAEGTPLAYQIEEWDAAGGAASVWVRVPKITGNSRQQIKLYWGRPDAKSESSGKAVFNGANGYLSVWHMSGPVTDEVGTLESKDTGTSPVAGVVGRARNFAGKQGLFCGDRIANYPAGASSHSTEAWIRAERPNATIIGWGNEGGGRGSKVRMQLRSPPHLRIDSDFADVRGEDRVPMGEWVHVAHTYERGEGKVYLNGTFDASAKPTLTIQSPARLWIGGWYDNYDFVGAIDEVRVSKVARPADWIRLEYENQKPLQTLVGPVVQASKEFGLSETEAILPEGKSRTFQAKAGGAQKVTWTVKRGGREAVVATNRFAYTLNAGRVVGDQSLTLRFKAVYPDGVKTKEVAVTVKETIPEPAFTLRAPATWDGRETIEVVPQIGNSKELQAAGANRLNYGWTVSGIATIREAAPGKLILNRAMNSGALTVTATIDNGGQPIRQTATIAVKEPAKDAWVVRTPAKDEKPEEGQFYARDDRNQGALHYNGILAEQVDAVYLKLYADDRLVSATSRKPAADGSYAFTVQLEPGLIRYRVEFVAKIGDREAVRHRVGNLVCGDAYLIAGQSNAVATDFGKDDPTFRSDWVRTFGSMSGSPRGVALWGNAVHRNRDAEKLQVGYWGMELARRLVESHKMPVCILNGAVGGTRIDQQQRNAADPEDGTTIYGRLLRRVRRARLTHGVRAILWHQGENDQGADGPSGGYGWETYRQHFIDLAAAWKQDYPNVTHYYAFQIWPRACAMGVNGSDNRLREVQRTLPTAFSNLSVMSTVGIDPPGGCHFPAAGYAEFARLIAPLVERDLHGKTPVTPITPPDLRRAYFAGEKQDEVVLEFDQPVRWDDALAGQFSLDGQKGKVASGTTAGHALKLKLTAPSAARTVTYLDSTSWSRDRLLRGQNGIAALTFCEVPILPRRP